MGTIQNLTNFTNHLIQYGRKCESLKAKTEKCLKQVGSELREVKEKVESMEDESWSLRRKLIEKEK